MQSTHNVTQCEQSLSSDISAVQSEASSSTKQTTGAAQTTLTMKTDADTQTVDTHCSCCNCITPVQKQYSSVSVQCSEQALQETIDSPLTSSSSLHDTDCTTQLTSTPSMSVQCIERDIIQQETTVTVSTLSDCSTQLTSTQTTYDTQYSQDKSDLSFNLAQCNNTDTSDEEELYDEDCVDITDNHNVTDRVNAEYCDNKYLVFDSQLQKLFKHCTSTDCNSAVSIIKRQLIGTMLIVKYTCANGHTNTWRSQPYMRHMPAGHLLLSAAILLSGSTYGQINKLCTILNLPIFSKSVFYRIQNTYLNPSVNEYWTMHQTAVLSVLSDTAVKLCGDARSDSPGFSDKYTSYTLMDLDTSLIVDQQLVCVTEPDVNSSVAMEKVAMSRSLEFLHSSGLKIHTLATDRHTGVRSFIKENYPEINHQFDVWHIEKNITKKLHKKALKREASELMPWIRHIANHLYWSAQTCNGDGELLREKWVSCIHHIANVHAWNGEKLVHCEHGEVDDNTCWLEIDSPAHLALKQVVLDKKLLKDIVQLSDFCHTGALEVYHSMLLKYAPKRLHFNYDGMQTRLQLAAIDHNYNVDRKVAKDKEGNPAVKQAYTKAKKHWILRNVYEGKQYTYIAEIMNNIIKRRLDLTIKMDDTSCNISLPVMKETIAVIEKPSMEEAKAKKYSRINN